MRSDDLRPLSPESLSFLQNRYPGQVEVFPVDLRPADGTASVIPIRPAPPALALAAGALRPEPPPPPRPVPKHLPNETLAVQLIGMSTIKDAKIAALTSVPIERIRELRGTAGEKTP